MGFVFKPCGRQRAIPITKATGEKAAALKRLRAFLDAEEPKTIRWLTSFWDKQAAAITYKELREAVLSGDMSQKQLAMWQKDYAAFVNSKLVPQWALAMEAAAAEKQAKYPYRLYDPQVGATQAYIEQRGAELVTNLCSEQRKAIQGMVSQAAHYEAVTADSLSQLIRPVIGLTAPQAIANLNYYNGMLKTLKESHPKMTQESAEKKAQEAAAKYAARQHRYRAFTIARTELAMAYNYGGYGATKDAQERGYIGDCKKIWLTADDERVCPICGGIDGESVNMDALFRIGVLLPPAHPSCRCAVAYEEITEATIPNTRQEPQTISDEQTFSWVSDLDEEQKIKFFGGKTKAALFDAGLLDRDDYFKPLKDIDLSGIMIPDRAAINHSILGEYKQPSRGRPNGRLSGGGHTDAAMREMDSRGLSYNILRTDKNGVRFGNVPDHDQAFKRVGDKQTWFPSSWTPHDVMVAGIAAANRGNVPASAAYAKELMLKGVNIRVLFTNGRISTICPSNDQPI